MIPAGWRNPANIIRRPLRSEPLHTGWLSLRGDPAIVALTATAGRRSQTASPPRSQPIQFGMPQATPMSGSRAKTTAAASVVICAEGAGDLDPDDPAPLPPPCEAKYRTTANSATIVTATAAAPR